MRPAQRIQRFRSGEEMNAAKAETSGGDDFARFLRHCARYLVLSPRTYPRGVFKFRSVEEMQRSK